jgi:hypothetical protein
VRGFLQQIMPELISGVPNQDLVEPPVPMALAAYPNPFNPQTTISFSLPGAGEVALNLYNTRGQKVRALVKERMEAGAHQLVFDGKDANGKELASGIYLLRLDSKGGSVTRRISLVK